MLLMLRKYTTNTEIWTRRSCVKSNLERMNLLAQHLALIITPTNDIRSHDIQDALNKKNWCLTQIMAIGSLTPNKITKAILFLNEITSGMNWKYRRTFQRRTSDDHYLINDRINFTIKYLPWSIWVLMVVLYYPGLP